MTRSAFTKMLDALGDQDLRLIRVGERPRGKHDGPSRAYYIEREGMIFMVTSAELKGIEDTREALEYVFAAAEDALMDERPCMTRAQFDELEEADALDTFKDHRGEEASDQEILDMLADFEDEDEYDVGTSDGTD